MLTHFKPESHRDSENSQSKNSVSLPTDWTTRNVKKKKCPSDIRKVEPDGNTDLHKGMMNTGKGNYMGKCVIFFFSYLILFQDNQLLKQKLF